MATTTWDKFLPLTAPHLPGCPYASIELALAESAAEFCHKTQIWRMELDADVTVQGEHTYQLDAPAVLSTVLRLMLDGREIERVDDRAVPLEYAASQRKPERYALVTDDSIRFYPAPDGAYTYAGTVALKPSRAARGVESFIYEAHANTLASGAISRLAIIPNKEWSNPDLAVVHQQLFERGVATARVHDFRNVPLRVTPRSFA